MFEEGLLVISKMRMVAGACLALEEAATAQRVHCDISVTVSGYQFSIF